MRLLGAELLVVHKYHAALCAPPGLLGRGNQQRLWLLGTVVYGGSNATNVFDDMQKLVELGEVPFLTVSFRWNTSLHIFINF